MPRPDPRAEPESLPPSAAKAEHSIERVAVSKITAPTGNTADGDAPTERVDTASRAEDPKAVTSADPRVAELEPLVERNDWKLVADRLGTLADIGKLPPNLGLIAALAHNELAKEGSAEARNVAIRCMAALLGMPEQSELVRVLGRRLLRKNPVRFRERPAPPAKTSALIVVVVLVVGGALGWFLSSGTFTRLIHR